LVHAVILAAVHTIAKASLKYSRLAQGTKSILFLAVENLSFFAGNTIIIEAGNLST